MADATHDTNRSPAPSHWRDAFAALPLEAPTTSRWAAIDAALDGTPDDGNAHTRTASAWPRRFACAAALAGLPPEYRDKLMEARRVLVDDIAEARRVCAEAGADSCGPVHCQPLTPSQDQY